jgi:putative membrane protein insertion efficiency factor
MTPASTSECGLARLPRQFGHVLVLLYRYTLAPLIGPRCRHLPGCSDYAEEAISRFGLWAGGWMALARILRCHPWGTHGLDFVPVALPDRARWWAPWRYGRWRGTNERPPPQLRR